MNIKSVFAIVVAIVFSSNIVKAEKIDSLRVISLQGIEIVSNLKEHGTMRQQPAAVSLICQQQMMDNHITSLKGISGIVPNLFIPDYGSRLTSAVYIRGIGSRINTPAVGLYVDNMPYADKSGFDFNFYDIERIDVMRGPQGTLYGRNTVGGVMKVFTRNPLSYQGTTVNLGFTTRDNRRRVSVMHYHRPSDKLAFSGGGYYEGGDGLFTNTLTNKKVDDIQAGGVKLRALWLPTKRLNFDIHVGYDYSDEGAYPYYYIGALDGNEGFAWTGTDTETGANKYKYDLSQYKGKITNNHESRYRRGMLNTGIGLNYRADTWEMRSMTSYQNLNDRMFMDQDFLGLDIYTIEQKQKIHTLTEELTFRNTKGKFWDWVSGINVMYQWLHTTGPVTFYEPGLDWLSGTINQNMPANPPMSITFTGNDLVMGGTFDTPTFNMAGFHQSTLHLTKNFSATLGLRLDYERNSIDYNAPASIAYAFSMPTMAALIPSLASLPLSSQITEYVGTMHTDYLKVLPKVALKYDFPSTNNNIYFSVTKGMRSGGYNVQMFSTILQGAMQVKMMDGVKTGVNTEIDNSQNPVVQRMAPTIKAMIEKYMPKYDMPDVSDVEYKPEYSWNYELGTHLTFAQNRVRMDAAVFYIHTNDQQVARFTSTGLGRMIVNAGESESWGGEFSAMWQITNRLTLTGNYGYTKAEFVDYDGGQDSKGEKHDYSYNNVPYVPQHTVNADIAYMIPLMRGTNEVDGFFRSLTLGMTYNGAGRIYWTEANDVSQPYYQTLGARASLQTKLFTLQVWAKNLTNNTYNTMYIESAGRAYEQHCRPFQMGIDLKCEF